MYIYTYLYVYTYMQRVLSASTLEELSYPPRKDRA